MLEHYKDLKGPVSNKSFINFKIPLCADLHPRLDKEKKNYTSIYFNMNGKVDHYYVACNQTIPFPKFSVPIQIDKLILTNDTMFELLELQKSNITYASIMDGEL